MRRVIPTASVGVSSAGAWSTAAPSSTPAYNAAGRATFSGVAVILGALAVAALQL